MLFMGLWSGGYVTAKLAILYSSPILLVAVRFAITLLIFAGLARLTRSAWPRGLRAIVPIAITGALIQGCYFTFCYLAFAQGITAGALALLMALQPILTACVAGPFLGERVRAPQWVGLALGFTGVAMVLESRLGAGVGAPLGVLFGIGGLASITVGTLFQKRFCPRFDLWSGGAIQFAAATLLVVPAAWLLEVPRFEPTWALMAALLYLVLGNSVIATSMLNLMIRKGEAARITSVLYLVPGGAALLAWLILGETMSGTAVLGLAIGAAGVALVMRRQLA
jgi:drug/metabolite transporter (DMT)-like permease